MQKYIFKIGDAWKIAISTYQKMKEGDNKPDVIYSHISGVLLGLVIANALALDDKKVVCNNLYKRILIDYKLDERSIY